MEVTYYHSTALSTADQEKLGQLQERVKQALADGVLSREESDAILSAVYEDGRVSLQECEVLRILQQKVWDGEAELGG